MAWVNVFAGGPAIVTVWALNSGNYQVIWSGQMSLGNTEQFSDPRNGIAYLVSVSSDGVISLERVEGPVDGSIYEVSVSVPDGAHARISDVRVAPAASEVWTNGYYGPGGADDPLGEQLTIADPCLPNPSIFGGALTHTNDVDFHTPSCGVYAEFFAAD